MYDYIGINYNNAKSSIREICAYINKDFESV